MAENTNTQDQAEVQAEDLARMIFDVLGKPWPAQQQ
jgi:hypothetical protein